MPTLRNEVTLYKKDNLSTSSLAVEQGWKDLFTIFGSRDRGCSTADRIRQIFGLVSLIDNPFSRG